MNLRPLGYEPNELPDCSTPRQRKIEFITECTKRQRYAESAEGGTYAALHLG